MRKAGLGLALVASAQLTLLSSPAFADDASTTASRHAGRVDVDAASTSTSPDASAARRRAGSSSASARRHRRRHRARHRRHARSATSPARAASATAARRRTRGPTSTGRHGAHRRGHRHRRRRRLDDHGQGHRGHQARHDGRGREVRRRDEDGGRRPTRQRPRSPSPSSARPSRRRRSSVRRGRRSSCTAASPTQSAPTARSAARYSIVRRVPHASPPIWSGTAREKVIRTWVASQSCMPLQGVLPLPEQRDRRHRADGAAGVGADADEAGHPLGEGERPEAVPELGAGADRRGPDRSVVEDGAAPDALQAVRRPAGVDARRPRRPRFSMTTWGLPKTATFGRRAEERRRDVPVDALREVPARALARLELPLVVVEDHRVPAGAGEVRERPVDVDEAAATRRAAGPRARGEELEAAVELRRAERVRPAVAGAERQDADGREAADRAE